MKLQVEARCHVGVVRDENQDALLVAGATRREDLRAHTLTTDALTRPLLFAVADGMGGHANGGRASLIVCAALEQAARALPGDATYDVLQRALEMAIETGHRTMRQSLANDGAERPMGTTVTALAVSAAAAALVHVGDSRAYRWRDGILLRLTRDHSVREMIDPFAPANRLANAVGAGERMFVDSEDLTGRLLPEDRVLLCSDGLWGVVDDAELEAILSTHVLEAAADTLLETVLSRGAPDNVSLLVLDVAA
ncbi:MAG TPA: PP2C family serine/threonine-protein phosphatase, partial [Gemmatimonadaceae bacterium]